jgi:hypothetical protein
VKAVQRTENGVDDGAPQPGDSSSAASEAISRYEALVDERLWESPSVKQSGVEGLAPTSNAAPAPAAAPAPEAAQPSGAPVRPKPEPASMAISRYEELVAERLGDAEPVTATPAWRRKVIAGALLVMLAGLAVAAFFWRTIGPSPANNVAGRPPANERAVSPPAASERSTAAATAGGASEIARLMARANALLAQRDIASARIVLQRAVDLGSAKAAFALAETYDPIVLDAWRTFGTLGDVARAQQLYAKAQAGGVQEAQDRLDALRK